jgi:hypothetical protein
MKLSEHTLSVLKNFSSINSGIVIVPGNVQKTISPEKSIFVTAELEDSFPEKFGIYDLNQFLGNITTMNNPDVTFTGNSVVMSTDNMSLNYYGCSPELIDTPPTDKKLNLDNPDVSFELLNSVFTKSIRLASMNSLPNLSVIGQSDGKLFIRIHDADNDTSNYVSTHVCDYTGDNFVCKFKTENLKIIPDDYTVDLKFGSFARFTSRNKKITYYIAMVK